MSYSFRRIYACFIFAATTLPMNNIRELYHLVSTRGMLDSPSVNDPDHKIRRFIELLADDSFSEKDIRAQLYGAGENKTAYRELKRRVHALFLEKVFDLSREYRFPHTSTDQPVKLRRNLFLAHFLEKQGYRYAAFRIALSCYRRARSLYDIGMATDALQIMREYYSSVGKVSKVQRCNQLLRGYMERQRVANKAVSKFMLLQSALMYRSEMDEEMALLCRKYLLQLKKVNGKYSSPQFYVHYARLLNLYIDYSTQPETELERLRKTWEKLEQFYLKNPQVATPESLTEISFNLSRIYIYLGQYEKAEKLVRYVSIFLLDKDNMNWFRIKHVEFILLCRREQVQAAISLVDMVMASPLYEFADQRLKNLWKLHEIAAVFLSGKASKTRYTDTLVFTEAVRWFRKDKTGLNITIYILEILWLLACREYDTAMHKTDTFRKYLSLHDKGEDAKRLYAFMKLLENYARYHGVPKPSLEKKYLSRLEAEEASYKSLRYEFVPLPLAYHSLVTLYK